MRTIVILASAGLAWTTWLGSAGLVWGQQPQPRTLPAGWHSAGSGGAYGAGVVDEGGDLWNQSRDRWNWYGNRSQQMNDWHGTWTNPSTTPTYRQTLPDWSGTRRPWGGVPTGGWESWERTPRRENDPQVPYERAPLPPRYQEYSEYPPVQRSEPLGGGEDGYPGRWGAPGEGRGGVEPRRYPPEYSPDYPGYRVGPYDFRDQGLPPVIRDETDPYYYRLGPWDVPSMDRQRMLEWWRSFYR